MVAGRHTPTVTLSYTQLTHPNYTLPHKTRFPLKLNSVLKQYQVSGIKGKSFTQLVTGINLVTHI